MKAKTCGALGVVTMILTACGGGGGGGAAPSVVRPTPPTTLSGTVAPPVAPTAGVMSAKVNMLFAPLLINTVDTLSQGMDYTFDPVAAAAVPATLKVTSLNIKAADSSLFSQFNVSTGAAYVADPTLGQAFYLSNSVAGVQAYALSAVTPGVTASQSNALAGLPTAVLSNATTGTTAGYVLPFSAALNPAGYTYQTFGSWVSINPGAAVLSEFYFSAGTPTITLLPVAGTASYTGMAAGSYVNVLTRDPYDVAATMNATADFALRTVAFSTTGTTSLSNNAVAGTLPTANAALNMTGTLSYAAGNNTFTGAVTTTNGMSGNATGRFYGPGIVAATPTKAVGAPPEIGGTFAVMAAGVGAMQGAFGGK